MISMPTRSRGSITDGVIPSLHVDYKHSRIKQYHHKEGPALRTETVVNNTRGEECVDGARAPAARPRSAARYCRRSCKRSVRIPVKVISDSGLNVISDSGQSDHRSERSDAGVGL